MLRILIADDNRISLRYFSELLDWNRHGFELVCCAEDGENAWMYFEAHRPEIVITDIQMPIISGIELARRIHDVAPETIVIFISSFKEFEYAHAALNLNVFSYLLKYETDQKDLLQTLLQAKQRILKARKSKKLDCESELLSLLERPSDAASPQVLTGTYYLYIIEQSHPIKAICALMHTSMPDEYSDFSFRQECYSFSEQIIAVVRIGHYRHLALIRAESAHMQFAYFLKDHLEHQADSTFSIVVHPQAHAIDTCIQTYEHISPLLTQLFFFPSSAVIESSSLLPATQSRSDEIRALDKHLNHFPDDAMRLLEHWYKTLAHERHYNDFCAIAEQFFRFLIRYDQQVMHPVTGEVFRMANETDISRLCSASTVYYWLKEKLEALQQIGQNHAHTAYSDTVRRAISYISQNCEDNSLSLDAIAEYLGVGVNTLTTAFRSETGNTVWQMMIRARLEHAKQYLEQTNLPISVISEKAGYSSVSYFSKAFRKMYAVSPQEYRKGKQE